MTDRFNVRAKLSLTTLIAMPHLGPDVTLNDLALLHDTALLYGKITIGRGSSIWPYVVMRAEMFEIKIGEHTNIQDFVMIHVGASTPTIIGSNCSITHHCTIHGCAIGDNCLIGINATIMDGARIGNNSIVAGHCIVNEGKQFPDNSVIAGVPGKVIATRDNSTHTKFNAAFYHRIATNHAGGIERLSEKELAELMQAASE
jgi:carbonic anhydrase/acetyltransferase-like protein (isoleucine patch superfamily)